MSFETISVERIRAFLEAVEDVCFAVDIVALTPIMRKDGVEIQIGCQNIMGVPYTHRRHYAWSEVAASRPDAVKEVTKHLIYELLEKAEQ